MIRILLLVILILSVVYISACSSEPCPGCPECGGCPAALAECQTAEKTCEAELVALKQHAAAEASTYNTLHNKHRDLTDTHNALKRVHATKLDELDNLLTEHEKVKTAGLTCSEQYELERDHSNTLAASVRRLQTQLSASAGNELATRRERDIAITERDRLKGLLAACTSQLPPQPVVGSNELPGQMKWW